MFTEHFVHEVDVLRRTGRRDRFGQPIEPKPGDATSVAGTYPARVTVARGGKSFTDRARDVIVAKHTVFLPLDADVTEADRISARDELGRTLVEDGIITMVTRPRDFIGEHHIQLTVETERGPGDAR